MSNYKHIEKLYSNKLTSERSINLLSLLDEYFRDIPRTLKRKATEETSEFVENQMPKTMWVKDRREALDKAIDAVNIKDGIWMELGIYSGQTINYIALRAPEQRIYGLDSFRGLQETWRPDYQKGMFATKARPAVEKNVIVVEGFFNKTLPEILKKDKRKLAFLHVDCDLYSSCKTAFDLLVNRIVSGTVFVFDEFFNYPGWKHHEYKAFNELVKYSNLKFRYLTYARNHSQVVIQFE